MPFFLLIKNPEHTIFKGFIGDLEQKSLCRVHSRRLLSGDREERRVKARRVFLQEETTIMVYLILTRVSSVDSEKKSTG